MVVISQLNWCLYCRHVFVHIYERDEHMPLSPNKIKYCTLPIQSYPIPGWTPLLKNLLPQLTPSLFSLLHPSNYHCNFNTCWNREKRGRRKKSQMIFSQPYLTVCSVDQVSPFIPAKRLEEVFTWKGNSLGGMNHFTSPAERGIRSYLQHTSAQSSHLIWERATGRHLSTSPDVGVTKHLPATATSSTVHYTVCVFA